MNAEQFESKVFKTNTHWYWTGALNGRGYGNLREDGKCRYAHRIAFELFNGSLASDDDVLHECDIPHCVNPLHLWRATHADNMADMAIKGRAARGHLEGEKHPLSKLTADQVISIRTDARTLKVVAKAYNISVGLVSKIRARSVWRHI